MLILVHRPGSLHQNRNFQDLFILVQKKSSTGLNFFLAPASQATCQSASQQTLQAGWQVRHQQQLIKPGSNHGGRQAD